MAKWQFESCSVQSVLFMTREESDFYIVGKWMGNIRRIKFLYFWVDRVVWGETCNEFLFFLTIFQKLGDYTISPMFDLDFRQERELKFSLSITAISSHFLEKPLRKENFISSIYFSHFSTILLQSCRRSQDTFPHPFFFINFKFKKINVKIILQISFFYPTKSTLTFCVSFSIILIINIHYHLY